MPKLSPKPKAKSKADQSVKKAATAPKDNKVKAKTVTTNPKTNSKNSPRTKATADTNKTSITSKRPASKPGKKQIYKEKTPKSRKPEQVEDLDEEESEEETKGISLPVKIAALVISPLLCGLIFYFMTSGSSTGNSSSTGSQYEAEEEDWSNSGVQTYKRLEDAPSDGVLFQEKRTGEIIDIQHLPKEYQTRYAKNPEFRKIR